jgi:Zn-dependent protease with chaperone function
MRWLGYWLIIDRELLSHRYFTALLAVQLAHANSEDRLAHRLYEMLPHPALVGGVMCGFPFSVGHVLLYPFWMWYWRTREFAADAFAVEMGQGYTLVRALEEIYLRVDPPTRGGRLLKPTPYVAERIDRIQRLLTQSTPRISRVI